MKKLLLVTMCVATLLIAKAAFAQTPDYEPGPVWRLVYYRLNPGQEAVFWKDVRENLKPMSALAKKEGIQMDYKIFRNPLKDHPGDWDVLLMLAYPNYAALDQLEAKADSLYLKHFGSQDKVAEAVKKRNDSREVVAVRLVREALLK